MKKILYGILMVICFSLSYLFINRGLFVKSFYRVNYQYDNDINYVVNYYDGNKLNHDELYNSNMVKSIDFSYIFDYLYDRNISGYYDYDVSTKIVAYVDSVEDVLWEKEESLVDSRVVVLNRNNINNININDNFVIDFNKYRDVINNFNNNADMKCQGYLVVNINFNSNLNFINASDYYVDNNKMKIIIPLTKDGFKISINGNDKDKDVYKVYNTRDNVNFILLVLGLLFLSCGLALGVLIFKIMIDIKKYENSYNNKIKKIFKSYNKYLVKVKSFYNNNKYNIIDVDNISELVKLCDKKNLIINYKEVKRNSLCLFVVLDKDNVYVYRLKV